MSKVLLSDHNIYKISVFNLFILYLFIQASRDHENRANYDQLERLASRVIQPLLGSKGLYDPPRPEAKPNDHKSKTEKLTPVSSIASGGSTPDMEGIIVNKLFITFIFHRREKKSCFSFLRIFLEPTIEKLRLLRRNEIGRISLFRISYFFFSSGRVD